MPHSFRYLRVAPGLSPSVGAGIVNTDPSLLKKFATGQLALLSPRLYHESVDVAETYAECVKEAFQACSHRQVNIPVRVSAIRVWASSFLWDRHFRATVFLSSRETQITEFSK